MSAYRGNIITKNPATPTGPSEEGSAPGMWTLNEALAFTRQGIWPTQGVPSPDPYFPYVTMLLSTTSLGNANNNLFVDSSGAFNPISRNGNTTQGSATPYSPNWSNYFDGSGDFLQLPGSSAFAIATSTTPFTLEGWIYPTASGGVIFSEQYTGSGNTIAIALLLTAGSPYEPNGLLPLLAYYNGSSWVYAALSNTAVTLNRWQHVAAVFTGSTTKLFINGVDVTSSSPTPATTWGVTGANGDAWYVGKRWDGGANTFYTGYISNFRFVNGTAVYTSAFTPPTSPLTAISGTSLLTCQSNRFRDASTNNFTITVNGDTRVTDFSPFSPGRPGITYNQSDITNWSGYFDGSGDYLDVPNSTAFDQNTSFTVEMWVYPTVSSTDDYIYSQVTNNFFQIATNPSGFVVIDKSAVGVQVTSSAALAVGVWTHIAMVSNGSTISLYINGTSQGSASVGTTATSATTTRIGAYQATGGLAFTGYISNARVVKGTAVYTSNFTPPTTNLTAVSGTSLLTLQNAAFTDNSTNNFVITPNGNVTVTGNSPVNTVGYWSNYLDNSGDYLTTGAGSSAFAFGTGDFTIEGWFYANSAVSNWKPMLSVGAAAQGQLIRINQGLQFTGNWGMLYPNDAGNADVYFDTGSPFPPNQWVHVALVRNGTTLTLYQNGVNVLQKTVGFNFTNTTGVGIGYGQYAGDGVFGGYISNVRIVKGTAVYTANFTPPTTPLTAITNTSLLTCQANRLIDSSANNFTITRFGDTSVQSFDPFYTSTIASNGGSMYFDGSGDYLTAVSPNFAFGTGAWTVEFWIYPLAYGGSIAGAQLFGTTNGATNGYSINLGQDINSFRIVSNATGSWADNLSVGTGNGPPLNAWTHMAVVRSGANLSIYKNGTRVATTASATSWNFSGTTGVIGRFNDGTWTRDLNGYLSNLRVTGAAVYDPTQSTISVPTAPVNPTAASVIMPNGMNAGIYDATAINDIETVGNAQVTTAVSKYGGSSVAFDGTGDYLVVPDQPTSNFGAGDFTVEMWINLNSFSGFVGVLGKRAGEANYSPIVIEASSNTLKLYLSTSGSSWAVNGLSSGTLSTGVWYHYAISRSGSTVYAFINGVSVGSTGTASGALMTNTSPMTIGQSCMTISASVPLNGYIDDFRITNGVARYTSNFTPPTKAFPTF